MTDDRWQVANREGPAGITPILNGSHGSHGSHGTNVTHVSDRLLRSSVEA
jgi:hypothetical protein